LPAFDAGDDYLHGSPEIVIDVLSPGNSAGELEDRRATWMAGGCIEFWTVDPRRRTVQIFDREGFSRTYSGDQHVPFSLTGQSFLASELFG
jgi:Uma2 family endonuclease